MRTLEDIKTIRFDIQGSIRLDLERVQEDPVWNAVTGDNPLETEDQIKEALVNYFHHYFGREVLLENVPSTCGPADIYQTRARVFDRRKKETQKI